MEERLGLIANIPLAPDGSKAVPTEFQVFPLGQITLAGGDKPFTVDQESINSVISAFQARGLDMVIDYEHQTEGGEYSSPDGKAPAAGWIKSLENRGAEGLWAKVEWTEAASDLLAKKEYRYYSPVFLVSKGARKLLELLRVALTNAPRLNWIKPIVAKNTNPEGDQMEFLKQLAKLLGLPETATQDEVITKIGQARSALSEFILLSAKECGLPETATSEQVIAGIKSAKDEASKIVASKDVLDALGLKHDASQSEVVANIHALKQRPDATVIQEIATLKARLAERDRDELVAAALKDGKITPAQKEWAEKYALADQEGFKLFVAKAPQVVPTGKKLGGGKPGQGETPDDTQIQINKLLGIPEETWKKHNPPAQA